MPNNSRAGAPNIIGNVEDQQADNENSAAMLLPPYQGPGGLGQPQQPTGAANRADEIMEQPAGGGRAGDRGREQIMPPMPRAARGVSKENKK